MHKYFTMRCLLVVLITLVGSDIYALHRDFSSPLPPLCASHLHDHYPNKILRDNAAVIPPIKECCRQVIDCQKCHQVWLQEWEVEEDDEVFTEYYWNCRCKESLRFAWDEDYVDWALCDELAIYRGYADPSFQAYFSLFADHLTYVNSHWVCRCCWPEVSPQAANISDKAYTLISALLKTTPMEILVEDFKEQYAFLKMPKDISLNRHGLTIALIAHCFFYSHYDCVFEDLECYSKQKFDPDTHSRIVDKLDDIRDALCPHFLKLYDDCLAKHPSPRIECERNFLLSKLGYHQELDSYQFRPDGGLKIAFGLDDKDSDGLIAALSPMPSDDGIEGDLEGGLPLSISDKRSSRPVFPLATRRQVQFRVHSNQLLEQGIVLSERLDYLAAIQAFSQAIETDPSNGQAYLERALAYFEIDQIDPAVEDYQSAKAAFLAAEKQFKVVPEFHELIHKWDDLSGYEQGRSFGYIVGKYGIDIFTGAGAVKLVHKFRTLRRANAMFTLECCGTSVENRATILAESTRRSALRDEVWKNSNLKIQWDKQDKHMPGTNNYREYKSILEHKDPQALVDKFAGTGTRKSNAVPGTPGYVEIVDFKEFIGYAVDKNTFFRTPTTRGTIHYAKDGVHIVPRHPARGK